MTLGSKLKKLRVEKNLTQKELADQLHVTFQTISKWENDTNEPDIATLKELAKLYECSIDYLLSDEEQATVEEKVEETPLVEEEKPAPVVQTVIIHQKELHVCERCKKDIPENELEIEQIQTSHAHRGHSATYRPGYYHKHCLEELHKERAIRELKAKNLATSSAKKKCFGWGIFGGIVALIIALLIFLLNEKCKEVIHPALAVLYAVLIGAAIFMTLYCIISGSYIADVFVWAASLSVKTPGVIFTWDIEGIVWAIAMKIFLAILVFLLGILILMFAIGLSAALSVVSFPFILIHNNNTGYADAL